MGIGVWPPPLTSEQTVCHFDAPASHVCIPSSRSLPPSLTRPPNLRSHFYHLLPTPLPEISPVSVWSEALKRFTGPLPNGANGVPFMVADPQYSNRVGKVYLFAWNGTATAPTPLFGASGEVDPRRVRMGVYGVWGCVDGCCHGWCVGVLLADV